MPLSANTLFHFTKDRESLLSILKTKFYPRACFEPSVIPDILRMRMAIPMVCFCDIPLSQISEHAKKYGNYGIGLKKEWAIEQGVTPVLYVHKNSLIPRTIATEIKGLRPAKAADFTDEQMKHLMDLIRPVMMMKPYEIYSNELKQIVRYYDEREWRYIPPSDYPNGPDFLFESMVKDNQLDIFNKSKEKYGVEFNPDVINYILVDKEEEILPFKRNVVNIKGNFAYDSVELLTTRILSMDRIKQDM